jgi:hypothetical protein
MRLIPINPGCGLRYGRHLLTAGLIVSAPVATLAEDWSAVSWHLGAQAGVRELDITPKAWPQREDDSAAAGGFFTISRVAGPWRLGVGADMLWALERDESLPGLGRLWGLRPVTLSYRHHRFSVQSFGGVAVYDWIDKAAGYYVGLSGGYHVPLQASRAVVVGLEYRYHQDLAHDRGPGGDQIVQGPAVLLQLGVEGVFGARR